MGAAPGRRRSAVTQLNRLTTNYSGLLQSLTSSSASLPPAGLTAATRFVELHSTLLEQLDLSKVLHFDPLREVVLDKLGMTPDSFPNADVTLTDFLKQAVADDVRLFIWALEEHREDLAPCHSLLDYYFNMMGTCTRLHHAGPSWKSSSVCFWVIKKKNLLFFSRCPMLNFKKRVWKW